MPENKRRVRGRESFHFTLDDLKSMEEERRLFNEVVKWQRASAGTQWVLGEPLIKMAVPQDQS